MKIVFDMQNGFHIPENNYVVDLTEYEKIFINNLLDMLNSEVEQDKLDIVKKSSSYTTITYTVGSRVDDLIRFKLTDLTMWAAVFMTRENAQANKNNPVFSAQKNKNQLYWKAKLSSPTNCAFLKPFILDAIKIFK